jgi:hypothetical protein
MGYALAKRPVAAPQVAHRQNPRITDLENLIAELKRAPSDGSRQEFAALFDKAQRALEATDLELSLLFEVSRPTIGRWARGDAAPHRLGRRPLFDDLIRLARTKIRQIRR